MPPTVYTAKAGAQEHPARQRTVLLQIGVITTNFCDDAQKRRDSSIHLRGESPKIKNDRASNHLTDREGNT